VFRLREPVVVQQDRLAVRPRHAIAAVGLQQMKRDVIAVIVDQQFTRLRGDRRTERRLARSPELGGFAPNISGRSEDIDGFATSRSQIGEQRGEEYLGGLLQDAARVPDHGEAAVETGPDPNIVGRCVDPRQLFDADPSDLADVLPV